MGGIIGLMVAALVISAVVRILREKFGGAEDIKFAMIGAAWTSVWGREDWENSDYYYYLRNPFSCECHHCGKYVVGLSRRCSTGRCRCRCCCEICEHCCRCKKTRPCGDSRHAPETETSKQRRKTERDLRYYEERVRSGEALLLSERKKVEKLRGDLGDLKEENVADV